MPYTRQKLFQYSVQVPEATAPFNFKISQSSKKPHSENSPLPSTIKERCYIYFPIHFFIPPFITSENQHNTPSNPPSLLSLPSKHNPKLFNVNKSMT
jgi:hypothetical protein